MTKPTPAHLCTSFNRLHQVGACVSGYGKLANYIRDQQAVTPKDYGMDRPIPVTEVLKAVGLADTIWVLRNAVLDDPEKAVRVLRLAACLFAEHALPIFEKKYPDDKRPRRAIEVSRAFANGEATAEELAQARRDAAAAYAAADAARLTEQQWQLTALTNLLDFEVDQCATTFSEGSAMDECV